METIIFEDGVSNNIEEIRYDIEKRIQQKKSVRAAGEVLYEINNSIEKYPELSLREKDFAFRYAMEYRTYQAWANFYGCSPASIARMLENPRVRMLVAEIQYDIRKYTIGMQMFLLREALEQYLRIFRLDDQDIGADLIETKRKAADKVVEWFGQGGGKDKKQQQPGMNVNFNFGAEKSGEPERLVTSEVVDVESKRITADDVEAELHKFRQLEDLRVQAERYVPKQKEPQEMERE